MRDGGAYGCAVPRAYANLNPGLPTARGTGTIRIHVECSSKFGIFGINLHIIGEFVERFLYIIWHE